MHELDLKKTHLAIEAVVIFSNSRNNICKSAIINRRSFDAEIHEFMLEEIYLEIRVECGMNRILNNYFHIRYSSTKSQKTSDL